MEELTLRQMQEGALNILKKLDGICREQGLRYFLFYGTLIGAIRHKGCWARCGTGALSPGMTTWTWPCPGRILTGWWNIAAGTGRSFCPCA